MWICERCVKCTGCTPQLTIVKYANFIEIGKTEGQGAAGISIFISMGSLTVSYQGVSSNGGQP